MRPSSEKRNTHPYFIPSVFYAFLSIFDLSINRSIFPKTSSCKNKINTFPQNFFFFFSREKKSLLFSKEKYSGRQVLGRKNWLESLVSLGHFCSILLILFVFAAVGIERVTLGLEASVIEVAQLRFKECAR